MAKGQEMLKPEGADNQPDNLQKAAAGSGDVQAESTEKKSREAKSKEEEMVEIELFEDGERYSRDVIVGVNGKIYQIQRGVRVKVPRAVKEVLDNSMKQDRNTARYVRALEAQWEEKRKKFEG